MKTKPSLAQRLFVALDVDEPKACDQWFALLQGKVAGVKIGAQIFPLAGPELVAKAGRHQLAVFLDLKFHDIPSTVEKAARAVSRLGVSMFTVHTSGGEKMLRACRKGIDEADVDDQSKPMILGVTVLTSEATTTEAVVARARLAQHCGCDGVVASAHEIEAIRFACGPSLRIVTPGLRFETDAADDQERIMTPRKAVEKGADYLVMGRSILRHPDPAALLQSLSE